MNPTQIDPIFLPLGPTRPNLTQMKMAICPVRDIKNRILQFSKPPILEFKRLQKAFKIKKQGLKYFLK